MQEFVQVFLSGFVFDIFFELFFSVEIWGQLVILVLQLRKQQVRRRLRRVFVFKAKEVGFRFFLSQVGEGRRELDWVSEFQDRFVVRSFIVGISFLCITLWLVLLVYFVEEGNGGFCLRIWLRLDFIIYQGVFFFIGYLFWLFFQRFVCQLFGE